MSNHKWVTKVINTIFFDLDGTLLPMDQDAFIKYYAHGLMEKCLPVFKERTRELILVLMKSIEIMGKNDGSKTNEEAFWEYFLPIVNMKREEIEPFLSSFYDKEFKIIMNACSPTPKANYAIKTLKEKGYRVVLTTNPYFPKIATWNRIKWAGMDPNDFEFITVYENSSFCKPNVKYYEEVISKLNLNKENILMVGNDVLEDCVIQNIGIPCYLIKDCLINNNNLPLDAKYQGNIDDFVKFVDSLPSII